MQYQKNKMPGFPQGFANANIRGRIENRNPDGINQIRGTILSKDENSITIKMADESSKIIILNDSTLINKTESGSKEDLIIGKEVFVFGKTNNDGSITADNIQVGAVINRAGR